MKPLGKKGESPFLRVRVPKDMLSQLQKLAEIDRRKLSDYIRLVLQDHIDSMGKGKGSR